MPTAYGSTKKQEMCPYFERGFCKLGAECDFFHPFDQGNGNTDGTRICTNYMLGFCPAGPECKQGVHVRSMITPSDLQLAIIANFPQEENWIDNKILMQLQWNQQPPI